MLEFALVLVFISATSALLGHIANVRSSPEKLAWYLQIKRWKAQLRISVNVTAHFANNVTGASTRLRGV